MHSSVYSFRVACSVLHWLSQASHCSNSDWWFFSLPCGPFGRPASEEKSGPLDLLASALLKLSIFRFSRWTFLPLDRQERRIRWFGGNPTVRHSLRLKWTVKGEVSLELRVTPHQLRRRCSLCQALQPPDIGRNSSARDHASWPAAPVTKETRIWRRSGVSLAWSSSCLRLQAWLSGFNGPRLALRRIQACGGRRSGHRARRHRHFVCLIWRDTDFLHALKTGQYSWREKTRSFQDLVLIQAGWPSSSGKSPVHHGQASICLGWWTSHRAGAQRPWWDERRPAVECTHVGQRSGRHTGSSSLLPGSRQWGDNHRHLSGKHRWLHKTPCCRRAQSWGAHHVWSDACKES